MKKGGLFGFEGSQSKIKCPPPLLWPHGEVRDDSNMRCAGEGSPSGREADSHQVHLDFVTNPLVRTTSLDHTLWLVA